MNVEVDKNNYANLLLPLPPKQTQIQQSEDEQLLAIPFDNKFVPSQSQNPLARGLLKYQSNQQSSIEIALNQDELFEEEIGLNATLWILIELMIKKADKNKDGRLSLEELKKFAELLTPLINYNPLLNDPGHKNRLIQEIVEIIKADKNNDGIIDDGEYKEFIKTILLSDAIDNNFDDEAIDRILMDLLTSFMDNDKDKDGQVSFEEFLLFIALILGEDVTTILKALNAVDQLKGDIKEFKDD